VFAYLTQTAGHKPGRSYVLQPGTDNLIGRGPECQVVLADPLCSRVHAVLAQREGQWQVHDQSRNGTFVNGEAVQEAILAEGSVLRIGSTELAFHQGEPSATIAAPLDAGLTQTIVRDTPVTQHDSSEMAPAALRDSPEGQDLWLLHQFAARLLPRRSGQEIVHDALEVLQERTEASTVAYFAVDPRGQLRLRLASPDGTLPGPLPGEALTKLVITQGRALWVANQQSRGRSGGSQHEADVLYVPVMCGAQVEGAFYVYLKQGHFRQSHFEFAVAAANLAGRALARAREDDRDACDVARAAAELGIAQELIGPSAAMAELRKHLERIAGHPGDVLLHGERGVGKKLVVRWLHEAGARLTGRPAGPLVVWPCGQVASADEGAVTEGWLKAEGGTLYLEEVGRLSPGAQPRLLELLEPGNVVTPACSASEPVLQRVIAGTSVDLRGLVRRDEFLPELLDVLTENEVTIPPLRERREDIVPLADHFLSRARLHSARPELVLSDRAQQRLVEHEWPGNVAELRQVVRLAALTATGPVIEVTDLPLGPRGAAEDWESLRIDDWERRLITLALQRAGGNVPEAAKLLGIGRATLYRKLEEYGIQR
jgi:Nif-specific regulatory protein